jgi:hypothetical protein
MRSKACAGGLIVLTCAVLGLAGPERRSAARLANPQEVQQRLGLLSDYRNLPGLARVKVAVLDYGFEGIGSGRPYLPDDTVVVEHYDPELVRRFDLGDQGYRKSFAPHNRHGRLMAQVVWAVTGSHPRGPKFYLLNANGPTMLRRAVRYAIEAKVDIILFSGSFEGGGNGDGRGPINRIVADALAADIIWVNAAGNFGRRVFNGPVRVDPSGYLRFRDGADGTALRFRNRLDENTVTVTLTWNDYQQEEDAGTDKDLDLYVEDWTGQRVGASEKVQVSAGRKPRAGESRNPRERVVLADLPANAEASYRIRIRANTRNFTQADRVRVLVTAARESFIDTTTNAPVDAVSFIDATGREEVYPPADNPLVLTVGEAGATSSSGPTADNRVKPDVILDDSRAFFSDGEVSAGSSNAAAYFAGIVACLKAAEPGLHTRHLLRLARRNIKTTTSTPRRERLPVQTAVRQYPLQRNPSRGISYPLYPPRPYVHPVTGRIVVPSGPWGIVRAGPYPPQVYVPSARAWAPARTPTSRRPVEVRLKQSDTASRAQARSGRRTWRTPSRAQLAELVRSDR